MITVLKGSPQYSIDSEGLMTIATTWMVMPKDSTLTALGWLEFQNNVEQWAGKPGDKFKKPKITTGREATEYTEVDTFRVDTVSWECMEGRTHYEVTYSNIQNTSAMRMIGNVSVERNENNETTKTINYRINIYPEDGIVNPKSIDEHLIESGTTVDWAGTTYRVTNTTYNAESAYRYNISITAVDMSVMIIGAPSVEIDGFGVHTASATWQYSRDAYASAEFPEPGESADAYLDGLTGYIIQGMSVEPKGVAGYNITFNAVEDTTKLTSVSARRENGSGTEYTYNYKSTKDEADDFLSKLGQPFTDEGLGADGTTVSSVSVDEESRGSYNVTLTAKTPNLKYPSTDAVSLSKQVSASGSTSTYHLSPKDCGWATMVNGAGVYPINFPPTTTFSYNIDPVQHMNNLADSGNKQSFTANDLLNAIKTKSKVGYDWVVAVYDKDGKRLPDDKRSSVSKLSDVSKVTMCGYVYAQPTHTRNDNGVQTSFRNEYFEQWNPYTQCPIMPQKSHITNFPKVNGRYTYLAKMFVDRDIAIMEFTVTRNYKGNLASVLKKRWSSYMSKAVDYVKNPQFTSYRCISFNPSELTDDDGDIWTSIEITVQALGSYYWNPNYNSDFAVYYVEHA